MLSVEECKKHVVGDRLSDQQVEQIRDSFYQLVEVLVSRYLEQKEGNNGFGKANSSQQN